MPGTGAYCQAPARPGPPCSQTPLHYPSLKKRKKEKGEEKKRDPAHRPVLGPNKRRCLPVLAGPSLAHCHRAFACSGVLIKSFIVLHSRKELRRNTEQDRVKGRRENESGEKKRE